MSHISPKITVITLNWNGADDSKACVRSLLALNYPRFDIVVCDNASKPESWQSLLALTEEFPGRVQVFESLQQALASSAPRADITLIQTGANLGYAGGMNVGMRYALASPATDYCWVLNNDTEVHPDALTHLVERMQQDESIGICGSSLVLHHDRQRLQAFAGSSYNPLRARSAALGINARVDEIPASPAAVEAKLAYVIGAAMLVSRRYMSEVGLMDERYFLYSEEHDWAQRGRGRFRLGYAPQSLVFHKHGATIGTASSGGSELSLFYLFRNKLAFTRRHHAALYPLAFASLVWEATKFALRGYPRKARAAWRGLLAEPGMRAYEKR